jgi:hypothetical protein
MSAFDTQVGMLFWGGALASRLHKQRKHRLLVLEVMFTRTGFFVAGASAALLFSGSLLAAPSSIWPKGVSLPAGTSVNENYRREFDRCDREGSFRGYRSRYTRCTGDENAVTALRRLPGGAIGFVSKLAVDLDGSEFACGPDHGRMDQCPTSLMLSKRVQQAADYAACAVG